MSLTLPESLRLLLPDGTIRRILLEDYLRGVVAAALPPDAPLEGMKALAVAARTFAANTHRHTEYSADVCTTRHCQAWNERANPRAARGVMETRGIVASFHDSLIEAFYFEHCDGKTRDAKGVLMNAPAYLRSVPCPCGFASMKGHGIGMCQRGMVAMARFGEPYDHILKHYYGGIQLQQLVVDEDTRVREPVTPARRAPRDQDGDQSPEIAPRKVFIPKPIAKSAPPSAVPPTMKPSPRVEPLAPTPGAPKTETDKPAHKPIPPRRSARRKIEQEQPAQTEAASPVEAAQTEASPAAPIEHKLTEPLAPILDVHSPEEDDLYLYLAVEDAPVEKPKPAPRKESPAKPRTGSPSAPPPVAFTAPPPSMPEELTGGLAPPSYTEPPPPLSMPEEIPSASELDFIAPPVGAMPEDLAGMSDFTRTPVHSSIEPDLADFMPPVERFFAPLDAPPTMPEEVPSFGTLSVDETPISWASPPPLQESGYAVNPPVVLMDALPGPRVIAGNLPRAGMLVTIRDTRGNSIVTVSGLAKQYGGGGFEAPLTDDGAYHVKFDGTELEVKLENETVFIYYQ